MEKLLNYRPVGWIKTSAIAVIAALFIFVGGSIHAEQHFRYITCTYCGKWKPKATLSGPSYRKDDQLIITDSKISLPGCSAVEVKVVGTIDRFTIVREYTESERVNPIHLVFISSVTPRCDTPLTGAGDGLAIEMEFIPKGINETDALLISVFPADVVDQVMHAGEIVERRPSEPGKIQQVKRHPYPNAIVGWRFARAN